MVYMTGFGKGNHLYLTGIVFSDMHNVNNLWIFTLI